MDNQKDRKKIDSILREPLTRARLFLNSKLRAAADDENPQPFTLEDFKKFLSGIRTSDVAYQQEALNVLEAVQTGKAPQEPSFETPETQLIWGAALAYIKLNPDQMKSWTKPLEADQLPASDLWKQITDTRTAYHELLSHAHHVREALRDKNTKYGWGDPGSGFTFDRQKNAINIDLMQSMIVGFEHARADVFREIGHSLLSVTYPKRMQEVFKEMRPLMKKQQLAQAKKGPKLKPDEYKKLMALSTEWQLRHMMFSAAEENVANKFVSNMGSQMLQDFSVSLNNTAVTFRGMGLTRLPGGDDMSEDLRRYMNLCNAVQLSFFANNELFDNTDKGWAKVGINPNLVRKTATLSKRPDDQKDDADGIEHDDFKHLRELCGGAKGLENLQPKQHERLYGWQNLAGRIERADADRKTVIEEIWNLYAEDLIKRILENANDQIEQKLKEAKDKKQDGQEGDEQDGDDGQEGQKGQKGQKGKKGKKQKGQRGRPQGDQDDSDDEDGDDNDGDENDQDGDENDQDGEKGKKSKKEKKEKKEKKNKKGKGDKGEKGDEQDGDEQEGEGQDGDEADGEKKGKQKAKGKGKEGKLGEDDEETVPVEGAGDMPAPKNSNEMPADELDPNGQGNDGEEGEDADGQDADGDDDGMTAEELEKELNKREQEGEDGEDADGEDADADGEGDGPGKKKKGKSKSKQPSKGAGHSEGQSLEELSKKDWTQYNDRISELAGPISRVRKLFKQVQERQMQRKPTMSRTLDILPQNGELKERFNMDAQINKTIKQKTGQLDKEDLKRFHTDDVKMVPTEIDIVILIDGSGSMNGKPLNSALQAAAIMFEAASGKDMKMNVYVGMWGNSDPPIIIHPGADRIKIGQEMERARKGLNSGTDFAPAIVKVAETIGEQRGKSGTLSGFTHVLVISDGDIFDDAKSKEMIQTMFAYSDKVTFDTAVIGSKGTKMEQVSKSIKGTKPYQEVGVTVGDDPNTIPMEIVGLLLEKVRKCGSFTAVPNSQKRRAMKKAHNKMDPKR